MANDKQVETFYDYVEVVADTLYREQKTPYLTSIKRALDILLDEDYGDELGKEARRRLESARNSVTDEPFARENVRKAIQLSLLKAFKHERITNAMVTPDSIGMFMAYLLKKLYDDKPATSILDPLAGTGNLLATLHNHYRDDVVYYGIDSDALLCEVARNLLDAMEADHQIFHQDTLTYQGPIVDVIVTDFPVEDVSRRHAYFPYDVILHHIQHLQPGGFFMGLIENDFFDQPEQKKFRERLLEQAHLFGLLKLDEGLFDNHPQSILLLQKKLRKDEAHREDFLIADLPPFRDEQRFQQALHKIENWFAKKRGRF